MLSWITIPEVEMKKLKVSCQQLLCSIASSHCDMSTTNQDYMDVLGDNSRKIHHLCLRYFHLIRISTVNAWLVTTKIIIHRNVM